jgi:hypothetical protein
MDLKEMHDRHIAEHWNGEEHLKHWRAWGSWFSWGSPVGLGLFLIAIGLFLVLLHYAGLIG